jgi:hypothetical protein
MLLHLHGVKLLPAGIQDPLQVDRDLTLVPFTLTVIKTEEELFLPISIVGIPAALEDYCLVMLMDLTLHSWDTVLVLESGIVL